MDHSVVTSADYQTMSPEIIEKHRIAGLDDRERGFNRLVELERINGQYRARFQYETTMVMTDGKDSTRSALLDLISLLQARGYTQLRSQLSFRGDSYLGTAEGWIEHLDSDTARNTGTGNLRKLWTTIAGWLSRTRTIPG